MTNNQRSASDALLKFKPSGETLTNLTTGLRRRNHAPVKSAWIASVCMRATPEDIASHPLLLSFVQEQSLALLKAYEDNFRLAAVFATQQRWLLAHAALGLYFRGNAAGERIGIRVVDVKEAAHRHQIASRNTADAFVQEMLRYRFVDRVDGGDDRRARPIAPTQVVFDAISNWAMVHLATLDRLDGGGRLAIFTEAEDAIGRLQPAIAAGLLASLAIRQPQKTFSLFTWLNNGGVIMDWLVCRIAAPDPASDRIPTAILSVSEMAPWLKLSRTQLNRKLREAEAMGSIGWNGPRDQSPLWVSRDFLNEMLFAQANKLAIIDAAFDATLR